MSLKFAVFAIFHLSEISSAVSKEQRRLNKKAENIYSKSFLSQFCHKGHYKDSALCQQFFTCDCNKRQTGLFECFEDQCDNTKSFFCEFVRCKIEENSNGDDAQCSLDVCEKYNLDDDEKALCSEIRFSKAMKDCQAAESGSKTVRQNMCLERICESKAEDFPEQCEKRLLAKLLEQCGKDFRTKSQHMECQTKVCESANTHDESCQEIVFWSKVGKCTKGKGATQKDRCIGDICQDESCDNQFCKKVKRRNPKDNCVDVCARKWILV